MVSPHSYGHGIGAGDVNGDGRTDILTPKGWFEAPPDPRSGDWKFHPDWSLESLGFLYVLDVNGDGRNDVVTSAAHNYGVFWLVTVLNPDGTIATDPTRIPIAGSVDGMLFDQDRFTVTAGRQGIPARADSAMVR